MKITIDTEACKKNNESTATALYLASLLLSCPITQEVFENARKNGYLKFNEMYDPQSMFPSHVGLSQTGEFLIEGIIADSKNEEASEDRCIKLAEKLREIFPSGKKPGYAYTWRDSPECIADRLKKFFVKYGNHSDEAIINATKEYVNSFNGNYTYMQLLKYFIWKNKVTGEEVVRGRIVGEVERQSQLAAYLNDTPDKKQDLEWDITLK